MNSRSFLASVLGLTLILFSTSPNTLLAQTKTDDTGSADKSSSKLEQARALSAASGRPILAVAGLAD